MATLTDATVPLLRTGQDVHVPPRVPPVVIASERADNPGQSITNAAELLVPAVIRQFFPERFEEEVPVRFIEHYPPIEAQGKKGKTQEYAEVLFDSFTPKQYWKAGSQRMVTFGEPHWTHLNIEQVRELTQDHEQD